MPYFEIHTISLAGRPGRTILDDPQPGDKLMPYFEIHTISFAGRPGRLIHMDRRPDETGWATAVRFDDYIAALDFAMDWSEKHKAGRFVSTFEIVEKTRMVADDTLQVVKSAAPSRVVPSPVQALIDGDPVPYLEDRIDFLVARIEDLLNAAVDSLDGGCVSELEHQIDIATNIVNGEA